MAGQEQALDRVQVKKAVQALQAYLEARATKDSLFDDTEPISLLFTFWKIPKEAQTIRIPLPHGQRTGTEEVCLFTRDEPRMTPEQTQRFYKRLLEEKGVKNITEIIPYKVLKTEYKQYEAKRRLLGNFNMFISDDRIRRLLPSHIGKHFYLMKKEPLSVNLQSKHLARDIQRIIQGTSLKINNKGSCCMARVAHSGMTADEVTENVMAAVQTVAAKMRMKGPMMKIIHIKSLKSVALPIYTSNLENYHAVAEAANQEQAAKNQESSSETPEKRMTTEEKKQTAEKRMTTEEKRKSTEDKKKTAEKRKTTEDKKKTAEKRKTTEDKQQTPKKKTTEDRKQTNVTVEVEEEEIPQLVPIETPTKKPKVEKSLQKKKKRLQKTPRPAALTMEAKMKNRRTKRADPKVKRKVPKVK